MSLAGNRRIVGLAVVAALVLATALGLGWMVSAAGTHSRTHDARFGDPAFGINVTSSPYNAKCDGATDDTSAIQSALNAAPSTGARVQVPATSAGCKITSTLTIPQNVILEGETPDTLIWFASTGNGPAIQIGSTTTTSVLDQHGGGLKDIGIEGNSSSGAYPNQVGVQISRAIQVDIDNVLVKNTGIGFVVDGGSSGLFAGDITFIGPMTSNVVIGIDFTNSGGVETDVRCCSGGYIYGYSHTAGYGIYATGLHSSNFFGYSVQHFNYGVYLDSGTSSTQLFGGRVEASGPENGTQAFVCNGTGTSAEFWGPHDSDVTTTTVQNTNSASCGQTMS